MPNVVHMPQTGALTRRDPQRLALFKKTVGKDLVGAEVDEAVEWAEIYGANPLTRDIFYFCFGEYGKPDRKVVPVLSVGLYRKIAARSGNYRPDDRPPRFTYDEALVGPANPKGIVDCEVTVYRHSHSEWFPITSRVRWEERAPIVEGGDGRWEDDPSGAVNPPGHKHAGKPKRRFVKTGDAAVPILDPKKRNWHTMPETMLAKCTEVDAIRKGWPNETAGSYGEGELDQVLDLTATEVIEKAERVDRFDRIGGIKAVHIDWMDGNELQRVPAGKFYDAAMAFIQANMKPDEEEAGAVLAWAARNKVGLQEFWAMEKDAALALKKELEKVAAFHKQPAETEKPKGKDDGGELL